MYIIHHDSIHIYVRILYFALCKDKREGIHFKLSHTVKQRFSNLISAPSVYFTCENLKHF